MKRACKYCEREYHNGPGLFGHEVECAKNQKDMSIGDAVALLKSKGYTLKDILEAGAELRRREQPSRDSVGS